MNSNPNSMMNPTIEEIVERDIACPQCGYLFRTAALIRHIESNQTPIESADAVKLWIVLSSRIDNDVCGTISESEIALFDALTKRLRYEANVVATGYKEVEP